MSDDLTPRERLNAAIERWWIRENRGRLHRPTCLDGNGCRCGLGDLPMWGGADIPEMPA